MSDDSQVASLPSSFLSILFIRYLSTFLPSFYICQDGAYTLTGMTDKVHTNNPLKARPAPLSSKSYTQITHPRRPLTARSSAKDDDSADYVVAAIQGRGGWSDLTCPFSDAIRSRRGNRSRCHQPKYWTCGSVWWRWLIYRPSSLRYSCFSDDYWLAYRLPTDPVRCPP